MEAIKMMIVEIQVSGRDKRNYQIKMEMLHTMIVILRCTILKEAIKT